MPKKSQSVFSRIISNTGILIVGRVLNAICSFVYVAWTSQALGLNIFGVMLLITTFATLISDITRFQSWQTLVHYGSKPFQEKQFDQFDDILAFCVRADFLSAAFGMFVGLSGILILGTSTLGWPTAVKPDALLCMLIILFMNIGWSTGMLRLCNRFKLVTVYEFITTCVRTGGCGIGYLLHMKLGYFLFVWCMTQFTLFVTCSCAGLYLLYQHTGRTLPIRKIFTFVTPIKGMWQFTLSVSFNQILDSVFQQGGTLAIGSSLGAGEAAVYRVARQISNGLSKPAQMIIPTLYPEFIRFRDKGDWQGMRLVTLKIFGLVLAFSLLVFFLTLLVGERLFTYMLHYSWPGEKTILVLLVCSALFDICLVPIEPLLTVMKRISFVLKTRISIIACYFLFLYGLMHIAGINGAALSSVITSFLMLAICAIPVVRWFTRSKAEESE
ncbi:MAG: lipopolysaccharide biosynthesis protein [Zymomonas mobilis]|uniref:O-antigen/teichoic acid export membrane protein n=1 Tax=Zymomonas mobilis TaxID=542 RepID=A0A542W2H0_ZYMMB|nr:lipopolysaccharide biosynthesis protein [Zymomonas mobilis]TQL17771.1 O-antigen/teichoic acid export membrane protein [Zymomonas mobilis]